MTAPVGAVRALCFGSYTALGLQQVLSVWLAGAPWIVWVGTVMPLLLFLPGMLRDNLRSFIWLCFVCLLYFMRLVVALFEHPGSLSALVGTLAVVSLFTSAMFYVRWRARQLRAATAADLETGK